MEAVAETPSAVTAPKRGKFRVNLAANLGYLGLTLAVGVWYVPYLVNHLGPAAYGLIPLASTLVSYMALITLGLNAAVGRTLTIALEREDHARANRIFNTSLWGNLALGAGLAIPAGLGLVFLDSIIRVPPGFEVEARWLFACVAAAFLLNEIKIPFDVSSYCRNRFDLRNLVATGEVLTRVGLVVLLFHAQPARIHHVGVAILCGTMLSAAGAVWLWRRLTPTLRIARRDFEWGALKSLAGTGGWAIVNQLGAILYLGIDLLVANRLFGVELAGKYAAVLALPMLIRTLGTTVSAVFSPTSVYYYARQDWDGLVVYLRRAIKCLGLMVALPVGLACAFGETLLGLWLGPAFGGLGPLLLLMTAHLAINMAINPLLGLQLTANRMKTPGIVTLLMGLGNLGLALLLAGPMQWGLYGIAAAGAIMLTLKNVLFTPLHAAQILSKPRFTFLWELAPIAAVTAITILLGRAAAGVWEIAEWGELILAGFGLSVAYAAGVYGWVLKPEERRLVGSLLQMRGARS